MAQVTEHDAKQEGESDNGVQGRIGFTVGCHSVCVNQILEATGELVRAVERRRIFGRFDDIQERWNSRPYCG